MSNLCNDKTGKECHDEKIQEPEEVFSKMEVPVALGEEDKATEESQKEITYLLYKQPREEADYLNKEETDREAPLISHEADQKSVKKAKSSPESGETSDKTGWESLGPAHNIGKTII